jgi:hypothetical protein
MNTTTVDPMDYCEYAALEILGWHTRTVCGDGYDDYPVDLYTDGSEDDPGVPDYKWHPDTDRNQLLLVLEKFMLSGAEFEDTRDWWYDCMKDPAFALACVCERHKSMTLAPEEATE